MSVEQLKVMKERTDLEINLLQDSLSNMLDKTTPHVLRRWIGCFVVACIYVLRVYLVQGFYIVSYGLGIYILNLLIGFLSPQVDPKIHDAPPSPPEDPMSSVLWFAASLSSSSGIMWKGEHSFSCSIHLEVTDSTIFANRIMAAISRLKAKILSICIFNISNVDG